MFRRFFCRRSYLKAGLAILAGLLLSACALPFVQPAPTSRPTGSPGVLQPGNGPTTAPTTNRPTIEPTVQPGRPTGQPPLDPTAQPGSPTAGPTVQPGLPALVGPEWRILSQGDPYGRGVETVIAYLPSSVVNRPQLPAHYSGFDIAAEQAIVVERNPDGRPWVRLQISLNGLFFDGDNLSQVIMPGLPDSRTIAMAVSLEQPSARLRIVPLDSAGKPVADGFVAFYHDGGMATEWLRLPGGQLSPLVGPEWTILGQGDLYGTGVETVVAYARSGMEPDRAQLPPQYVGYGLTLERLVIVQRNARGEPWVRVLVTPAGVFMNGDNSNPLFPPGGPNGRTQGFALAMEQQSAPQRLVPLDSQGKPVETGFVVSYDAASRDFKLRELILPGDQVIWPGPDWVVAHQGDFNYDGMLEKVYLLPSALRPDASFNTPAYANYSWVAEAIYIAQEQDGYQRLLATINLSEVRSENALLATLSSPGQGPQNQPAAFFVSAPWDLSAPVAVIPLNRNGQGYTQGFGLAWDTAGGAYRLVSGPGAIQQPAIVSGRVAYPAGGAPPLEVYAINVDEPARFYMVRTELNMPLFTMRLPAGRYHLLAYTADQNTPTLAGLITAFPVAQLGIPSFVASLAGWLIYRGALQLVTEGTGTIIIPDAAFNAIGNDFIPDLPLGGFLEGTHKLTLLIGIVAVVLYIIGELNSRRQKRAYDFEVLPISIFVLKLAFISVLVGAITWVLAGYRGLSWTVVIMLLVVGIYHFITTQTVLGRHIYAVGGNPEAAELSGINVKRITYLVFASMGMLSSLSGILFASRLQSATTTAGTLFELDAIAAAYVGGVSAAGGVGKVAGSIIGALVMTSLTSGMNLMGVGIAYQYIVRGAVLAAAVIFDVSTRRAR